jgi:predicted nucleotidyltransferase
MKIKSNKEKLQEHFFVHPTSTLRVREIERATGLPLPSITKYLKELLTEGILQEKIVGKTKFYTANRGANSYRNKKILFNIQTIFEAKLIEHIIKEYHNPAIRLFGSYAKGEDTEDSDIDIYVQTPLKTIKLDTYEQQLKKKIHVFAYKSIRDIENIELANNIMNGIPLNGYIEVFQ